MKWTQKLTANVVQRETAAPAWWVNRPQVLSATERRLDAWMRRTDGK
jgi:hypothetical protein